MRLNKAHDYKKGQSLVELAILLPILIMLLFGIVEFGRIFNALLVINNASREGARYGVLGYTDLEIEEHIKNVTGTLDETLITVNINPPFSQRYRGQNLSITIGYSIDIITPGINLLLPNPTNIESTTEMRVE